jgi:glutamyl-tRNA synthetase/glutamyl-Q tRNA(Asp) synthetase
MDEPLRGFTTRFAPAPTGFLHLGHVANAILVWGLAGRFGGRVLLRIEDHDRSRCRPAFERALLEDLAWLGFVPDEPPVRQSERGDVYERALARLAAAGLVYVCDCTRAAIHERVPTAPGMEARYPGTCRTADLPPGTSSMRRIRLDAADIEFDDARLGAQLQSPHRQCGDLLARDRSGSWTYQFAAVVDDLEQGIDWVIRGEDLLASTGRQIQLARLLGREAPPRFLHHPLIVKPDGAKLSKSNRDSGVRDLRESGHSAARVRGLAAAAVGLLPAPDDLDLADLPRLFDSGSVLAKGASH